MGHYLKRLDIKNIKTDCVENRNLFWFLQITQDLNKIKKPPSTLWYTLVSRKQILAKNIELCGSWSSSKFSIFQTKNLVSRKQ